MSDDYALLAAEISNWPSKADLVKMFEAEGYAVYEGRYSVRLKDFDHFAFQELGGDLGPGCITADHPSVEAFVAICERVSQTLGKNGIRHRFEVYSGEEDLAAYLHHDWPKDW